MSEAAQQIEHYLTIADVAKILKIADGTLYNVIGRCGEAEGVYRMGARCTRIKASIFLPLFEAGKIPPKGANV